MTTMDDLKAKLLLQRERLMDRIEALKEEVDDAEIGYETHQADAATMTFDQEKDAGLLQDNERTLTQVEKALERFDEGTYGICEDCGEAIDIARLEAIPYTSRCLRCAEHQEFRADRGSRTR